MSSGTEIGNGGRRGRLARTEGSFGADAGSERSGIGAGRMRGRRGPMRGQRGVAARSMRGRCEADARPTTEAFGKKRERTKKNGAKKLPLSK